MIFTTLLTWECQLGLYSCFYYDFRTVDDFFQRDLIFVYCNQPGMMIRPFSFSSVYSLNKKYNFVEHLLIFTVAKSTLSFTVQFLVQTVVTKC